MAGRPPCFDEDKESILITVGSDLLHNLDVSGFLSLDPYLFPGTGIESSLTGFAGFPECFLVHISHHQDFFRRIILDYGRNKSVCVVSHSNLPDGNFLFFQIFLQLRYLENSIMEERRRQGRCAVRFYEDVRKILFPARAARCDYRNRNVPAYQLRQRNIISSLCAVPVHAGEQYLSGAEGFSLKGGYDI